MLSAVSVVRLCYCKMKCIRYSPVYLWATSTYASLFPLVSGLEANVKNGRVLARRSKAVTV